MQKPGRSAEIGELTLTKSLGPGASLLLNMIRQKELMGPQKPAPRGQVCEGVVGSRKGKPRGLQGLTNRKSQERRL